MRHLNEVSFAVNHPREYTIKCTNIRTFYTKIFIQINIFVINRAYPIAPGAMMGSGGGIEAVVQAGGTTGNVIKPIK